MVFLNVFVFASMGMVLDSFPAMPVTKGVEQIMAVWFEGNEKIPLF